ncbi:MAG: hypothetical protein HFE77_07600 [Clostridiales bacterium]|nr:hypothetical protein [Clostridiales bacterium]
MMDSVLKSGENRSFSCVFVSDDIDSLSIRQFQKRGLVVIGLPRFEKLPRPVASHPDMLLYPLGKTLLMHEEYYEKNKSLFAGLSVCLTNEPIGPCYPHDILFNALATEKGVFCLEKYTSRFIKANNRAIINVKQGYARCSTALVNKHALITADPSIEKAALLHHMDVLRVRQAPIALPGYSYGFIGGCCVRLGQEILFTGDITVHPDYAAIRNFLKNQNCEPVSLSNHVLTDYGGFVLF